MKICNNDLEQTHGSVCLGFLFGTCVGRWRLEGCRGQAHSQCRVCGGGWVGLNQAHSQRIEE